MTTPQQLIQSFADAGGFLPDAKPTPILSALRHEAETHLQRLLPHLHYLLHPNTLPPTSPTALLEESTESEEYNNINTILQTYDLLHRIARGKPDNDLPRRCRIAIAERWLRGDEAARKALTRTDIILLLRQEIDRDIRGIDDRHLDYTGRAIERWMSDLRLHGRLLHTPLPEARRILRYLSTRDLTPYRP